MRADEVWPPIEVQFSEEGGDREKYGDRWYRYDEESLVRRPVRELVQLEGMIGSPLVDVMNGVRVRSTFGNLAAAWIAVRATDPDLAGKFEDFQPLIVLAAWRPAEDEEMDEGKAEDGGTESPPPPVTGYHSGYPSKGAPSVPMDTVTLPTLPIAE